MALRYKTVWYGTAYPDQASRCATISFPAIVMRHPEDAKSLVAAVVLYSCQPTTPSAGGLAELIPHLYTRLGDAAVPSHTLSYSAGTRTVVLQTELRPITQLQMTATDALVSLSSTLTVNFSLCLPYAGALAMGAHGLMIGVTYEYDDASARQTKTAILPLHPEVNSTPTTEGRLAVIPILQGAALPETSASVFHGFVSILGCSYRQASTGLYALHLRAEGSATYSFAQQSPASTDYASHYVWPMEPYGLDQALERPIYAYVTGSVNHVLFPQVVGFFTYDFENSAVSRVLCHAELPFLTNTRSLLAAAQVAVPLRYEVPEGGVISLGRSAVLAAWAQNTTTNKTLSILAGGQSVDARTYSWSSATAVDYKTIHHPIDASSSFSTALVLAEGVNFISNFFRVSNVSAYSNLTGSIMLNYVADTPSAGVGAATHVLYLPQPGIAATATAQVTTITGLPVELSDYWVHAAGLRYTCHRTVSSLVRSYSLELSTTAGDSVAHGYMAAAQVVRGANLLEVTGNGGGTESVRPAATVPLSHLKRHQFDPDPARLNLTGMSRTLRHVVIDSGGAETSVLVQVALVVCYHSVMHSADRVVTGYSGAGDGINVATYRADTGEKVWECSTSGAGLYRTRYYWRGHKLFDEARQDDAHVGRSNDYSM